jgi:hypothetical protein
VTGYKLVNWGSIPRLGRDVFPLTILFILALGSTQPPIQWVLGTVSPGEKQLEYETETPSSVEVKNLCSFTSTFLLCLHGMVLRPMGNIIANTIVLT